jgi:sugar lactone lactonase YvrE
LESITGDHVDRYQKEEASMRALVWLGVSVALALPQGTAAPKAAGCDPLGNVQFVCGVIGPEDLVVVPGAEWVVASGDAAGGAITLINVRDRSTTPLFPSAAPKLRLDAKTYASCPGPLDPEEKDRFRAHGLYLRAGRGSLHTLYVVHHGTRESIEVFELDVRAKPPTLTWIGCAVAPEPIGLNSVVGLPDGGFAATNFQPRGAARGRANMQAGEKNGELWEWHSSTGWKIVPGSEASGANGIEISKDGKWFYMGGWGNQTFIRMSRGQTPVKRDDIPVGFRLDNLRWSPDGSLFAAGQEPSAGALTMATSRVIKIDPNTLKVQDVIRYPFNDVFNFSTVAVQVGKEIWVGSVRGDRVARFPAAP